MRLRTGHSPDDPLAALAIRVADHLCSVFGPDGIQAVDGHPEIEVALVELHRATGVQKYLDQARLFVERRGHRTLADIEFGRRYFQDEVPVRETKTLHGHAVRALYLAAGAIDCAVESDDDELLAAVMHQYQNALARRTYITGGMGSHHQDEAIGEDFELPADRAYCETCAEVASIMVAWRLLLATGDISWGDIIERTLYNIVAASLSQDGRSFFYANTLHQRRPNHPTDHNAWSPRASDSQRSAWFEVSCCPPNLSRTIAQLASYVATTSQDGVQLIQYMSSDINLVLPDGEEVALRVDTDYPNDSHVRIHVLSAPDRPWSLTLRIPRWATGATVAINAATAACADGPTYAITNAVKGDVVVLDIPLNPRFSFPDPRIDAVRGCAALERGPVVMCVQSVDQEDETDVAQLLVDTGRPVRIDGEYAIAEGGVLTWNAQEAWPFTARSGTQSAISGFASGDPDDRTPRIQERHIVFSPYWAWANSGSTTMRVWVPISR
ncbi:glycoside hydrolase family 127 protein [Changpingibacter yushuensis]|uniref:glycoside hydrolase family 127 protein n=1 Tax=Changpingibacter yushuensis TaxID=2758440 RepID=UPI003742783F